jgi:hypothetical protein
VGVDPVGGCRFRGGGFREKAGGVGRAGRHWVSLPDGGAGWVTGFPVRGCRSKDPMSKKRE